MSVLSKGTTFTTGQQVTATNLNNLVDSATFASGSVDDVTTQLSSGSIIVKDGGITAAKIGSGAVTSAKLDTNIAVTGTLSAGGTFTASGLIDASGASAGQIKFPATQNASTNANTLDDYEEGTWTPSVGGTATYTTQTGTYTKIGRLVIAQFNIQVATLGTGSNTLISGLPFAPAAIGTGSISEWQNILSNSTFVGCYANTSSQVVLTNISAAGSNTSTGSAIFQDTARVRGVVMYHV